MLYKFKKIIKIFLGYGVSQFIVILMPIILLPILTNKLQINEFANYSLYKSLHGLFIPFISFGISTYILKYYYIDLKKDLNKILFTSALFSFLVTILLIGFSYFFFNIIDLLLDFKSFETLLFVYINTFLFSIHTLLLTSYRAKSKINYFIISNFSILISTLFLISFINYFSSLNLLIVLIIHAFSYTISIVLGLVYFIKIKNTDFVFDYFKLRNILYFCFPIFLYNLFNQISSHADRLIINSVLFKADLAIYSATFQLAFGVAAMGSVLQLAWNPYIFKVMAKKKVFTKDIINKMILLIIFIVIFIFIYYLILPYLIQIFLPENYFTGDKLFKWFVIGGLFQVFYWIINPFLIVYDKNKYFVYITLFSAIISVYLNSTYTVNGIENAAIIYSLIKFVQLVSLIIFVVYAWTNYKKLQY